MTPGARGIGQPFGEPGPFVQAPDGQPQGPFESGGVLFEQGLRRPLVTDQAVVALGPVLSPVVEGTAAVRAGESAVPTSLRDGLQVTRQQAVDFEREFASGLS